MRYFRVVRLLVHFGHQPYRRCALFLLQSLQTLQMLLKVLLSKLTLELACLYCFLAIFQLPFQCSYLQQLLVVCLLVATGNGGGALGKPTSPVSGDTGRQ